MPPGAPSPLSTTKGMISKGRIRDSVTSPFSMMFQTGERVPLAWGGVGVSEVGRGLAGMSILNTEEFQKTSQLSISHQLAFC